MNHDDVTYVYKYLAFDDGALRIIRDGTIKFTSPLDFNDPFDCRPFYDPESVATLWKTRPDLYRAAAKARGLSPAKRLQQRDKWTARLRREIESGRFVKGLVRDVGVCCLSRVATDILMWSHYANFHRGFVIELGIPRFGPVTPGLLIPLPVQYSDTRPRIDIGESIDDFEELARGVLTKATHWQYECEERVIEPDRPPGIYPYDRARQLTSVIAGMEMPANQLAQLDKEVTALDNVRLYQAQEVRDEYRIHVPGHPRLA